MTNWRSVTAPNEVIAYFQQYKCVICGSPLEEEPICFDTSISDYIAYCDCAADNTHYERMIGWHDPKELYLEHEEIKFEFEDRFYKIKCDMLRDAVRNEITITEKDVDGNEDESNGKHITLFGKLFKFRKFNPKQFSERVNVSKVFC